MIFRTLLFFLLLYFLVKTISRFFLSGEDKQGRSSGFDFSHSGQNNSTSRRSNRTIRDRIDQIEEAEFEDVTDDSKAKDTD